MLYLYVALVLLAETLAISFLKKYRISSQGAYFALGYVCYIGVCLLLIQTFHYAGIGIVNVLWSAFSVLFVVLVGHFYFKEPVTRNEILGMCLVIAGVALLPSA